MKSLGIRWRLTLWYGAVVAVVLVGFSSTLYVMMRHFPPTDEPLLAELNELEQLVRNAPDIEAVANRCERYFRRREGYRFQVRTAQGETVFRSERLGEANLPIPRALATATRPVLINEVMGDEQHLRIASRTVRRPGGSLVVQAAASMDPYDHQVWRLQMVLLAMVPLALIAALGGGYVLARKALAPMDKMVDTASMITALQLNRRIAVPGGTDELGRLAETLNNMISRLERSFEEVRRFTADAAHELRTPLAIMRSEAEIALRSPRAPEEYRRVIESMLEETAHLSSLAEQLLFLCREDSGLRTGVFETVSLSDLLEEVADQIHVAARDQEISMTSEIAPDCLASGDPQQLRRLFLNLIDNAIKYCDPGGTVAIRCTRDGDWIEASIEDNGCGIPSEDLPLIFDRFYRVDSSRTNEVKGTGLGLSIARSITESHGGTIDCTSKAGVGSRFRVRIPRAATQRDRPSRAKTEGDSVEAPGSATGSVLAR